VVHNEGILCSFAEQAVAELILIAKSQARVIEELKRRIAESALPTTPATEPPPMKPVPVGSSSRGKRA
jgi:hypothetical protein